MELFFQASTPILNKKKYSHVTRMSHDDGLLSEPTNFVYDLFTRGLGSRSTCIFKLKSSSNGSEYSYQNDMYLGRLAQWKTRTCTWFNPHEGNWNP